VICRDVRGDICRRQQPVHGRAQDSAVGAGEGAAVVEVAGQVAGQLPHPTCSAVSDVASKLAGAHCRPPLVGVMPLAKGRLDSACAKCRSMRCSLEAYAVQNVHACTDKTAKERHL